jgi:hypothetical protein
MLQSPLRISSSAEDHSHPLTSHPPNKSSDHASLKPDTPASHTPHRIPTSQSCPNLFKLASGPQEVDSPPHVPQETYKTQEANCEESRPKSSSWFRFSRRVKSGKLSKRAPSFSVRIPTSPLHSGQPGSSSSAEKAQTPEAAHLDYLTPLTPGTVAEQGGKLPPFTGGLDRESPVWQIIQLKGKLAHHEEVKKKACLYSKRYKTLLAEFEELRQISEGALKILEENIEDKDYEIRASRAESNRHKKLAEYWERLYDAEVAKVAALQSELEGAMRQPSPNLDSTDSPGPSSQLASDDTIQIGLHETELPISNEIIDIAYLSVENDEEIQTSQPEMLSSDMNLSTVTPAAEENEDIPLNPRDSQLMQLRFSFGSCFGKDVEDILHKLDDVPDSRP